MFLCTFLLVGTYNVAVKAAKNVLDGDVARTEVETDYDQPRKRKKNKKYIESSSEDENEDEDNSPSNISRGTSNKVPAPDPLLSNKLKLLFKNKAIKTSAICQEKDTSVGRLFLRKESRLSPSKLTHKTTLDENSIKHHFVLKESMYIF